MEKQALGKPVLNKCLKGVLVSPCWDLGHTVCDSDALAAEPEGQQRLVLVCIPRPPGQPLACLSLLDPLSPPAGWLERPSVIPSLTGDTSLLELNDIRYEVDVVVGRVLGNRL